MGVIQNLKIIKQLMEGYIVGRCLLSGCCETKNYIKKCQNLIKLKAHNRENRKKWGDTIHIIVLYGWFHINIKTLSLSENHKLYGKWVCEKYKNSTTIYGLHLIAPKTASRLNTFGELVYRIHLMIINKKRQDSTLV